MGERTDTYQVSFVIQNKWRAVDLSLRFLQSQRQRTPESRSYFFPVGSCVQKPDYAVPAQECLPVSFTHPRMAIGLPQPFSSVIRGFLRLKARRIVWCFRSPAGCQTDRGPGLFPRRGRLLLRPEVRCVSMRTLLRQTLPLTVSVFSVPLTVYGQAICSGILEQTDWSYRLPRSTGVLCSLS